MNGLRRVLPLLLCGMAVACDGPVSQPPPKPKSPVSPEPPKPIGPTSSLDPLEITQHHVGPLTTAVPYTVEAVASRFPRFTVGQALVIRDGDMGMGVIAVADDEQRLLEIMGKTYIAEVRVLDRRFATPSGRRVGQTWAQAGFRREACSVHPTWFDESTALSCRDDRDPGLRFFLSIPKVSLSALRKGEVVRYDKAKVSVIEWSHWNP